MRPKTIVNFERLIFASLALGVIQSWLNWSQLTQLSSPAFVLEVQFFTFVGVTALTLLVSRWRSKVAMWIFIALFALGLPAFIGLMGAGILFVVAWISVVQTLGQAVAIGLLFTRPSQAWLNREVVDAERRPPTWTIENPPTDIH